eukprot:Opistho-2@74493
MHPRVHKPLDDPQAGLAGGEVKRVVAHCIPHGHVGAALEQALDDRNETTLHGKMEGCIAGVVWARNDIREGNRRKRHGRIRPPLHDRMVEGGVAVVVGHPNEPALCGEKIPRVASVGKEAHALCMKGEHIHRRTRRGPVLLAVRKAAPEAHAPAKHAATHSTASAARGITTHATHAAHAAESKMTPKVIHSIVILALLAGLRHHKTTFLGRHVHVFDGLAVRFVRVVNNFNVHNDGCSNGGIVVCGHCKDNRKLVVEGELVGRHDAYAIVPVARLRLKDIGTVGRRSLADADGRARLSHFGAEENDAVAAINGPRRVGQPVDHELGIINGMRDNLAKIGAIA